MSAELSFVLSQFTRLTDRQTDGRIDGFTIAKTALHTMQRGKKQHTTTITPNSDQGMMLTTVAKVQSQRHSCVTVTIMHRYWRRV